MESGTTKNLFENTIMITNRLKADMSMDFMTNSRFKKTFDEVG